MNCKYRILLVSSLAILPLSMSVFGATGPVSEELPSYLDQQHAVLASQNTLMADTSPQAYAEEFTDPFTGFYIAIGPNWVRTEATLDVDIAGFPSQSIKSHQDGFGANINFGYGADLNNFYLGGELFFNYVFSNSIDNADAKDYDFGGALRLGYVFSHHFMLYLLAGGDVWQYGYNKTETKFGLMPGIGAEYLFNDNWGIKAQYTYAIYPKDSFSIGQDSWELKTNRSNIGLDVVYRFNYK